MPLDQKKMIRSKDVAKLLSCVRSTVYRYLRLDPTFPRPMKVGLRMTLWDEEEIIQWLRSKRIG
jgi:predicted DNA-binding transcriptional regulator AlpA